VCVCVVYICVCMCVHAYMCLYGCLCMFLCVCMHATFPNPCQQCLHHLRSFSFFLFLRACLHAGMCRALRVSESHLEESPYQVHTEKQGACLGQCLVCFIHFILDVERLQHKDGLTDNLQDEARHYDPSANICLTLYLIRIILII